MASVRPNPSKLAGEFRRGRSGNMEDSVEYIRFGERGFGELSFSFFASVLSPPGRVAGVIDCGDSGVLGLLENRFLADAPCPEAKSKFPSANALLFSDCLRN